MKHSLRVAVFLLAAATGAFGQVSPRAARAQVNNDEEALKQLVREWADAAVHGDLARLDKIKAENFRGSADGQSFDKKMFREAVKSGALKIAAWTIEDVKVEIRGSAATVSGRSVLTNAVFMGKDYSGEYEWTDRFVRQKDGTWRAVTSQAKRVKK